MREIHWPDAWRKQAPYTFSPEDENGDPLMVDVPISSTWRAMEEFVVAGKARSIGISNFSQVQIEELLST